VKRAGKLLALLLLVALAAAALYRLVLRDTVIEPGLERLQNSLRPASLIGEGPDAVGVAPSGIVLGPLAQPEDAELPRLPLLEPPPSGRLAGPALQQARVLGAAPTALRPYIESSYYGESGVDVNLRSGIELRFGDASQAKEKWRAAAAVLADPAITSLDYVDLHVPRHPAIWGAGHTLPSVP
jgi:hypothetical protein